ncbi:MAG: DUF6261 family protein [Parabacteroides sp.]|nr:DUF6261 family protein [Parabacteroides sp.]
MKKVLERKYLGLARNGEHYHLFLSLLQCVTRATAEELKILAVWSVFSDTLEKENEAYLNSQKYENTVPLTEANKACDQRFSAFSMNVKAKAKSYVAEVAAAADRVVAAMEPYKGAARKAHAENIAMVLDMTEKLQSDKYAADIATLGLTADLEDLRQSAIVFDAALSAKANERLARVSAENMLEIRPVVEAAFADVADLLTAIYLVAAYVDQDTAKAAKVEAIIDKMNAEILRLIETLNRRGVGAKVETPSTDPTTPTDPEPEPEPEPENPDVV